MPKDTLDDITEAFTDLNKTFETFKEKNDARIAELETKGTVDPLLTEQVKKLNDQLDLQQKKMDDFAAAQQRSDIIHIEGKTFSVEELDTKAADWAKITAKEFDRNAPTDFGYDEMKKYEASFDNFMRKDQAMLEMDERKALSVGSNPDGGYIVSPDRSGRIVSRIFDTSPMRSYAAVQTITKDSLEGLFDIDEASAGWVNEQAARPETDTPKLERWAIPVHELYANPRATQKLLDDADLDMAAWLEGKVSEKFARIESAAFVTGDGVGKPRGFTTYPDRTVSTTFQLGAVQQFDSGVDGAFAATPDGGDKLIEMITSMKAPYRSGAIFAMNRLTVGGVRLLKNTDGAYIWQPGLTAGQPSMLLGHNIAEFDDMADYTTTGGLAIAFANFGEGYQIVDRQGIRVLRDPYSAKPFIQFYTVKRVGGDVVNFEAIKLMRFAS